MKIEWQPDGVFGRVVNEGLLSKGVDALKEYLVQQLSNRVQSAWIFGSRARTPNVEGRDLDLLLVVNTAKRFLDRVEDFEDLYQEIDALDIIVLTPKEFEKILESPPSGFWKSVVNDFVCVI